MAAKKTAKAAKTPDPKTVRHLGEKLRAYGEAAYKNVQKGKVETSEEQWEHVLETLDELYRELGLK